MNAGWAWFAANPLITTLFVMMVADVAMGVCLACGEGTVSSSVSHRGMMRKAGSLILVGIAYMLQRLLPDYPFGSGVCMFFIATEGMSVIENGGLLGIPIPKSLSDAFEKLRQDQTPKQQAKRSVTVKTDSVVIRGRDTSHGLDVISDVPD